MNGLLHELVYRSARRFPTAIALAERERHLDYSALSSAVDGAANGFAAIGLRRGDRVGVYLDKRLETVVSMFGAAAAGAVFVPINPILKPAQVGHIMRDCGMRALVTSRQRAAALTEEFGNCADLDTIILADRRSADWECGRIAVLGWDQLNAIMSHGHRARVIDTDMVAILYTSGSTGQPKGVVLSHRNLVAGAVSVSGYLQNTPEDRILSVLPLSFDAGFSQLTTAFAVGARAVLLNYAVPQAVVQSCRDVGITGITGVPPLWIQLAALEWPESVRRSLRYFANTGGHMPRSALDRLRSIFPAAKPYLMYGLTEAFRSTYLDPAEVDRRPDSIGKAIPNAEVLVVRPNGELCDVDEPGELVHRGALVSLGYWNDPEKTAARFRPSPAQPAGICLPDMAVWSGDIVRRDGEGFLYFIGRRDDMIKTSGYRVSPTEVEEVLHATGLVAAVAVFGVAHRSLGQGIIAVATPRNGKALEVDALMAECRRSLPAYMSPLQIIERDALPTGPNGKIDRKSLANEFADAFVGAPA